jgi:hypothetical protein
MQSGLFGVTGLKGGTSTNNWNRDPDFLHQDVPPARTPSSNNPGTIGEKNQHGKSTRRVPLPAMNPEQLKNLVSALSTPEILQVRNEMNMLVVRS